MTHYEVLGLPPDATQEQIKRAFRKLSSKAHPDRASGSESRQVALNLAYAVLSDPKRKAHYDESGSSREVPPLRHMAMDQLGQLLSAVIEGRARNPLAEARTQIIKNKEIMKQTKSKYLALIEHLKSRLNQVKTKGDAKENIFNSVIESRIREYECAIAKMPQGSEVLDEMLRVLLDYECGVLELPQYNPVGYSPFSGFNGSFS